MRHCPKDGECARSVRLIVFGTFASMAFMPQCVMFSSHQIARASNNATSCDFACCLLRHDAHHIALPLIGTWDLSKHTSHLWTSVHIASAMAGLDASMIVPAVEDSDSDSDMPDLVSSSSSSAPELCSPMPIAAAGLGAFLFTEQGEVLHGGPRLEALRLLSDLLPDESDESDDSDESTDVPEAEEDQEERVEVWVLDIHGVIRGRLARGHHR